MGILFWMLIRTIIFSMIGNSFYKWFAGTTWGIWFDMKMKSILNKIFKSDNNLNQKTSILNFSYF